MMTILNAFLGVSALLAIIRCWRGPDWTDRILTFDLMNNILIASAVLYGISTDDAQIVTLVFILAPLSFISSAVVIFYLERNNGVAK